jgi:hypothetical protein
VGLILVGSELALGLGKILLKKIFFLTKKKKENRLID